MTPNDPKIELYEGKTAEELREILMRWAIKVNRLEGENVRLQQKVDSLKDIDEQIRAFEAVLLQKEIRIKQLEDIIEKRTTRE